MTLRYHTPLSPEEQISFGLSVPQPIALADRVRYAELDVLNHVNNKSYMGWFESLRVAHFERFCAPFYRDQPRPRTVLRSANMRFIREMHLGEDYVATARVAAVRTTSYTVEQQLWSGDLRATLTGVMVMLRPDGSARWPLPDALRRHFIETDGAIADS
jgi:acyl-CoA thioester hydrolase